MQIFKLPAKSEWKKILERPSIAVAALEHIVQPILDAVKKEGDAAIARYTKQFDGIAIETLLVTEKEINEAEMALTSALKLSILQATANIKVFHLHQVSPIEIIETMQVHCKPTKEEYKILRERECGLIREKSDICVNKVYNCK